MIEQTELMYKVNLQDYMMPGIQLEWLETFYESVTQHILNVRTAGMLLGVPWSQVFVHDASKFTVEEFPAYARQFHGDKGDPAAFQVAWLHHQNHNPHHWEYWIMRSGHVRDEEVFADKTTGCLPMPNLYVREMVADWMGASKSYTGSWSIRHWWRKHEANMRLHPNTRLLLQQILKEVDYGN